MAKKLKIRDLTLRDGQQSSFATRMNQEQIDRCLPYYKDANFYAMEVWGGAVPDSVMRYLNENPWTRLETIHKAVGKVSKLTPCRVAATCSAIRPTRTKSSTDSAATPSRAGWASCVFSMR